VFVVRFAISLLFDQNVGTAGLAMALMSVIEGRPIKLEARAIRRLVSTVQ
jgi:hypothetical protein